MSTDRSPRVTVLVPTIGRSDFLPATRASLAAQTFEDYEILVLDNASPPAAAAILEEWARADSRVRVLRCEPRIPMFTNFKRGVLAARGEFVTFCHDDDVFRPRFIERSLDVLEKNPDAVFSGTNYVFIDLQGNKVADRDEIARTETWSGKRYIRTMIARGRNPLTMQSVFYRRSVFGDEGFDDSITPYFGDFVILARIAEEQSVALIAETLVEVRQHPAQASNSMNLPSAVALRTRLINDYIAGYRQRRPYDAAFADELQRLNDRAHLRAMVWGWMASQTDDEARECLDGVDARLAAMLRGLDRIGARSTARRVRLAQHVRRLAGNLGL